tara:strand:+ start:1835 stop:2140 length:306 start_codon:yes stop_codon:yes gene_type:complete
MVLIPFIVLFIFAMIGLNIHDKKNAVLPACPVAELEINNKLIVFFDMAENHGLTYEQATILYNSGAICAQFAIDNNINKCHCHLDINSVIFNNNQITIEKD